MNPSQTPWGLEFEVTFEPAPSATPKVRLDYDVVTSRLQVTVSNETVTPIRLRDVRLEASIEAPADGGWAWLHGRYMQMDALVRRFGAPPEIDFDGRYARLLPEGRGYVGREVLTLTAPAKGNSTILAGSLRQDRFFFDIEVRVDDLEEYITGLALVFDLEGTELAPESVIELPPVMLAEGNDPLAMIELFADEVAEEMSARVPGHVPTGWCSWYYFYDRVSEADVVANLEEMVRHGHPAEYVQIDDGYQSSTGDWLTPNEKFPSGMRALAERVREAGYRPGLWLAPLVLSEHSAALRENSEMALRTKEGETFFVQTWLGRCAVLDCTHPRAEEWLREVVRTVVRDWGYEYLKLDALAYAARGADLFAYHTPGMTGPANLRRGLEIIREEAGDETFILGCTCHFGPAIGLVDAMRVGPDVKAVWAEGTEPSVRQAMRMTLQRNWMHRRWWVNDPDCLIVRETDTELNEAEVRFLATGIALSGGMVVASDDLTKSGEGRLNLALALFPPAGVAARPVDPSEGPAPSAWRAPVGDGRALVGVLNWDDEPRWVVPGEYLVSGETAFDVWNGRLLGKGDILLRPHEGTLWQVTAYAKGPRVVGDTGHINYEGLYQRQVSGRLQVLNDTGRVRTLAIEARGRAFEVDLAPGEARWFD